MLGRLIENSVVQKIVSAYESTTAETLYNGAASTTNNYFDSQLYDEVVIVLNVGNVMGSASVTAKIKECATDDISSATVATATDDGAVASAIFTAISTSTKNAIQVGSLLSKNRKRYLWLETVQSGTGTATYAATIIGHKADEVPAQNVASTPVVFALRN